MYTVQTVQWSLKYKTVYTVYRYLLHRDGVPAVDESVERHDGNLLGALVVAEGAHPVSLLAGLPQQGLHVEEGGALRFSDLGSYFIFIRPVTSNTYATTSTRY